MNEPERRPEHPEFGRTTRPSLATWRPRVAAWRPRRHRAEPPTSCYRRHPAVASFLGVLVVVVVVAGTVRAFSSPQPDRRSDLAWAPSELFPSAPSTTGPKPGSQPTGPPVDQGISAGAASPTESLPADPTHRSSGAGPAGEDRRLAPSGGSASRPAEPFAAAWEAESGTRTGIVLTRQLPAASGGTVVCFGLGGSVRFAGVTVPTAGERTLTIAYSSSATRPVGLRVNSGAVTTLEIASAGGLDRVSTVSVRVTLAQGPNTIEFTTGLAWAPDLDRITVR